MNRSLYLIETVEIKWAVILFIILLVVLYFMLKKRLKLEHLNKLFIFGLIFMSIGYLVLSCIELNMNNVLIGIICFFIGVLITLWNLIKDIIIFKKRYKEGAIKEEKDFYLFKNIIYDLNLFIPGVISTIFISLLILD